MSKVLPFIKVDNVSKVYRQYKNKKYQLLNLFGYTLNSQSYNDIHALKNINFEVRAGEKIGLIGRNGSGKSTLLKIISGQLRATQGHVQVNGKIEALMELGVGFYPDFTGRQNIYSALSYTNLSQKEKDRLCAEIIDFSELRDFIDFPVKTYSAGMYSRLAFSVSTTMSPEILIVDEILGAGDAYFAAKCVDRMKKMTSQNGSILLFVSHDLAAVQMMCDRALWFNKGEILMDSDPITVGKHYMAEVRKQEQEYLDRESEKSAFKKLNKSDQDYDIYGAGGIEIEGFTVSDSQQQKTNVFETHDDVFFNTALISQKLLDKLKLVITIYGIDGACITQLIPDCEFAMQAGQRLTVTASLRPCRLGVGEYLISVAVFQDLQSHHQHGFKTICGHDRKYKFKIIKNAAINLNEGQFIHPFEYKIL